MQQRERRSGRDSRNPRERRSDRDPRKKRRKPCYFCANKTVPDYKIPELLRKFITERGKIMTQRGSGCCASHQRAVAKQIKRARQIGFLPYTAE